MHRRIIPALLICLVMSTVILADEGDTELDKLRHFVSENGYGFTVGRTSVMDLSESDRAKLTGFIPPSKELWENLPRFSAPAYNAAGASIDDPVLDWRTLECVTPVRNQGACGSCWAFAAVGQLESFILINDGVEMDLSEQHIIDCNSAGKDCTGGNQAAAYDLMISYGSVTESCIPYTASDGGSCGQAFCTPVSRMDGYAGVNNDVVLIKTALLQGPVYTAFRTHASFYAYTGGCYDLNDLREPDHALLLVGWDDTVCGTGAWIVKNSWGEDWGDSGYAYIKYGVSFIGLYSSQITYSKVVELVSPNGGQTIRSGDDFAIRWDSPQVEPDSFSILYSLSGADPFDQTVATGLAGISQHLWTVPDIDAENVSMRIDAYLDGALRGYDISDETFGITMENIARQNFPNPFSGSTSISYSLSEPGRVKISIYDIHGALVRVLENLSRDAGTYVVEWDGTGPGGELVSSGVFFCLIETGPVNKTKKIVLVR